MAELGDLFALQQSLLIAAVASLDAIPNMEPELDGAPLRQAVVPPGDYVIDCDQVIVFAQHVGLLGTRPQAPTAAAGKKHVFGRLNEAHIGIVVTRCCIPTGVLSKTGRYTPPTPEEQETAAEQLSADGWALWNGLFIRMVNEDINDALMSRCDSVEWGGMTPIGPSGACGGWLLSLRVKLAGYMDEGGS